MYIGVFSHEIDDNFDLKNDSKFGGDPSWLCGKEPKNLNFKCITCKKDLLFLFQLSTSYDEYIRIIYIFCCMNTVKCNMDKKNWVCVKAKKKLFNNSEKNNIKKHNLNTIKTNFNQHTKRNYIYDSTYSTNKEKEKNIWGLSSGNNEEENITLEQINTKEEKLIDWNSLFSKNAKDEKPNVSLFSNSINDSIDYVSQKKTFEYNMNLNNINEYKNYNKKHHNLINFNSKLNNNENELNKYDKIIHENIKIVQSNNHKLPSYYISLIEDDDEYGKDYLYEKAKKMYEVYEHNKCVIEDEECNNEGNCDIDNKEESFENDFNGCVKFYSYLSKNYNQILRYEYNGKYLYMHKYTKKYIKDSNMICLHCKNKLVFELQFFSTFIYLLEKKFEDKKNNFLKNIINNFSVGNVMIFTCEMDCVSIDDMYSYEHIELEIF